MNISTFASVQSNIPVRAEAQWPDDFMESMPVAAKEDAPLWAPASFRPSTTRANGNVQLLDAMVLDYDGKTGTLPDIEGIAMTWAQRGLEFVLHTSFSHTEQAPRLRVILPYSRPATPAEHTATWLWAQQMSAPYDVDPACKDAARIYYVPCHAEGTTPTLLHWPGTKLVPQAAGGTSTPAPKAAPASPFAGIGKHLQTHDYVVIEAGCAFLRHARDDAATLPEPEWYAAMSIWARCKNGERLAHDLSRPHPGYTVEATDQKFTRAEQTGPRTCADVRTLCPSACLGCPQDVASPIMLDAPAPRPAALVEGFKAALKEAKRYGTIDDVTAAAEALAAAQEAANKPKRVQAPAAADPTAFGLLAVDGRSGLPKASKGNLALIFDHDPRYADTFKFDLFAQKLYYAGKLAEDHLDTDFAIDLEYAYGIAVPTPLVSEVVIRTARRNAYHPVRNYLASLEHDGVSRCDRLLLDGFGVAASPEQEGYFRKMAVKFLVSAVARVMRPGCDVQAMLVLTGMQGAGKSRGLRALASPEWFLDTSVDIGSKDAVLQIRGKWIFELAEMDSLKKAENTRVKMWVSSAVDTIRPPFGRHTIDIARETVFAATTNQPRFLTDSTGSRRYMVAHVQHKVDVEWIANNRDQLWAEAVALYASGTAWHWTFEEAIELQAFNEQYQERDPWDEVIRAGLGRLAWTDTTAMQVLTIIIGKSADNVSRHDHERCCNALSFMGCARDGDVFHVPDSLRVVTLSSMRVEKVLPFGAK
jgi:hypothetical protein